MLSTPIVFVVFNRPDLTARVFNEIRRARPSQLLVIADGPRQGVRDDEIDCAAARAVATNVDWKCEVLTNVSDVNLGLRTRVSTGLTWAFQQVEEAIILEDDCLPHPSFFPYCCDLLTRFREDTRIMSISGDNYLEGRWRGRGSYYFSKYATCWGWATWHRAWKRFDLSMSYWPEFRDCGALHWVCRERVEHDHWHHVFEAMYRKRLNSWAYAWLFAHFANNGLSVHPNRNLISNIGFGPKATHCSCESPLAAMPTADIGPLGHPSIVIADADADFQAFRYPRKDQVDQQLRSTKNGPSNVTNYGARRVDTLLATLIRRLRIRLQTHG